MSEVQEVILEPSSNPEPVDTPTPEVTPAKGDWVRTRQCACPPTSIDVCQIQNRPKCPHITPEGRPMTPHLRWLWARYGAGGVFDDSPQDPTEQVAEEMTKKLLTSLSPK